MILLRRFLRLFSSWTKYQKFAVDKFTNSFKSIVLVDFFFFVNYSPNLV